MGKSSVEKICRKHAIDSRRNALYMRWLKRQASKLMRRLGKRGDDAPKRLPTRGWSD